MIEFGSNTTNRICNVYKGKEETMPMPAAMQFALEFYSSFKGITAS